MKPHIKVAAISAAKWSAMLSAGFILGPIVVGLFRGTEMSGNLVAQKLVVGILWFPISFFGLWVWGVLSKKDPLTGATLDFENLPHDVPDTTNDIEKPDDSAVSKKSNKWNYICIATSVFILLFLFLPQIFDGNLGNEHYIGIIFWIGVIIYYSLNITRAKRKN